MLIKAKNIQKRQRKLSRLKKSFNIKASLTKKKVNSTFYAPK